MELKIITKEDLQEFRLQLLEDIKSLIARKEVPIVKPWLRNADVKELFGVSASTLHRWRTDGLVSSSKIRGIYYYKYEDVEQMIINHAA